MVGNSYKENHYVPCWYQERFLPTSGQRVFRYLDLEPEQFRDPKGVLRTKNAIRRWGASLCFKETDLYTVRYGNFKSTEIEQFFFGKVDRGGKKLLNFSVHIGLSINFRPRTHHLTCLTPFSTI